MMMIWCWLCLSCNWWWELCLCCI